LATAHRAVSCHSRTVEAREEHAFSLKPINEIHKLLDFVAINAALAVRKCPSVICKGERIAVLGRGEESLSLVLRVLDGGGKGCVVNGADSEAPLHSHAVYVAVLNIGLREVRAIIRESERSSRFFRIAIAVIPRGMNVVAVTPNAWVMSSRPCLIVLYWSGIRPPIKFTRPSGDGAISWCVFRAVQTQTKGLSQIERM